MNRTRTHPPPSRRRGDRAAGLVEYAMVVALIAFVCITAISFFGSENGGSVNSSADSILYAGTP